MDFLKAEQLSTSKWRVLSIPFGGPKGGKDLDDEFFSPKTDIKPEWFDRRPLVWHHNLDRTMKGDAVLGTADDLELDEDTGWWSTLWLDRSHRYWEHVNGLLSAGKVYGSSGSLPNFVKTDHVAGDKCRGTSATCNNPKHTGEILVWPFIEQTLTPTPANPFSVVVASKAIDHLSEAQIGLPPAFVKAALIDLDSHEADLPSDLPTGGDEAAIQRPSMDPNRVRAALHLARLGPRVVELNKR